MGWLAIFFFHVLKSTANLYRQRGMDSWFREETLMSYCMCWQMILVKGHLINILVHVEHKVPVAATPCYHVNVKTVTDSV